jgi:hypothetical protein
MGHGIFPNYGPNYIKDVAALLSRAEAKEVFYTSAKEKKARLVREKEEEKQHSKKKERKK